MILTNLVLLAGASAGSALVEAPKVEWTPPSVFVDGTSFIVHVELTAPKEGATVASWVVESGAFSVNGAPLGQRGNAQLTLSANQKITIDLDLGPHLASSTSIAGKDFQLGYGLGNEEKGVRYMQAAAKGLDFMKMPVEELSSYHVILSTNRGDMEAEFWPDVAPNHVRNFLDLSYTGFYDGKIFHRVIPGFMIQGGDPTGTGSGNGPRMLKAEFNDRKHEPGVLSMARTSDPNSASCQFFVMHKTSPHLDNQYSAFGKVISGMDTVEKIVNSKRNSQDRPFEPQTILKATVVKVGTK